MKLKCSSSRTSSKFRVNGFISLSELLIAASIGAGLIVASGLALQSTATLIRKSQDRTTLQENSAIGLRLMRSEIEGAQFLLVNQTEAFVGDQARSDLSAAEHTAFVKDCTDLYTAQGRPFTPIFGAKVSSLDYPILYGMSVQNGNFTLERCGLPVKANGEYNTSGNLFGASVINNIGTIPCRTDLTTDQSLLTECGQRTDAERNATVVNADFSFTSGRTPSRSPYDPALRVEIDENYKLISFIDPTDANDYINESFVNKRAIADSRAVGRPLHFTAFARADEPRTLFTSTPYSGIYFGTVTSKNVRFALDVSASMGFHRKPDLTESIGCAIYDQNGTCLKTRLEALKEEMIGLLNILDPDVKIGITAYSTTITKFKDTDSLIELGPPGSQVREDAIDFVDSLEIRTRTNPWPAIADAFADTETDTLYFLTDGVPSPGTGDNFGGGDRDDWTPTIDFFISKNLTRTHNGKPQSLEVNTTVLGNSFPWMEDFAVRGNGIYRTVK
ncbi:MAG: VWA domain-containing protein [Synechococcus sp.]